MFGDPSNLYNVHMYVKHSCTVTVVRLIDINILRANFTLITKSTTFATPIHSHESQISPTEPLYNLINAHSHLRVFHHHCSHSQQGQLLHLPPLLLYTTVTTVNYYVCTNKGRIYTLGTNTDELMIYKYVGHKRMHSKHPLIASILYVYIILYVCIHVYVHTHIHTV